MKIPPDVLAYIADHYQAHSNSLVFFSGGEESSDGTIFRFKDPLDDQLIKIMFFDNQGEKQTILKLKARLDFLAFLQRNKVPVINLVDSKRGEMIVTLKSENGTWIAYGMQKEPGTPASEKKWDPHTFSSWGSAIGKLHRVSQNYPSWQSCVDPVSGEQFLNWEEEWHAFSEMCQEKLILEKWVQIHRKLTALPINRESFGFIHNDPHIWNLRKHNDKITLLDFDVANHHWFINDIAIACQHVLFIHSGGLTAPVHDREKLVGFLNAFWDGYQRENDLDKFWLSHLDLFFAYRRILLYLVMAGWRESVPQLRKSWKDMIINEPVVLGEYPK